MSRKRHAVPDELWEKVRPCLPLRENPHPGKGGRKPREDRIVFHAILFVLHTASQWNALNATGICSSSTAHRRFRYWAEQGFFHRLWEEGIREYDETKGIDWSWLSLDGAMTKSPLGGEKKWAKSNRPWEARRQKELAHRYKRHPVGLGPVVTSHSGRNFSPVGTALAHIPDE